MFNFKETVWAIKISKYETLIHCLCLFLPSKVWNNKNSPAHQRSRCDRSKSQIRYFDLMGTSLSEHPSDWVSLSYWLGFQSWLCVDKFNSLKIIVNFYLRHFFCPNITNKKWKLVQIIATKMATKWWCKIVTYQQQQQELKILCTDFLLKL